MKGRDQSVVAARQGRKLVGVRMATRSGGEGLRRVEGTSAGCDGMRLGFSNGLRHEAVPLNLRQSNGTGWIGDGGFHQGRVVWRVCHGWAVLVIALVTHRGGCFV